MTFKALLTSLFLGLIMATGLLYAQSTPNPIVKLQTTQGDIFVEVFTDKAPISGKNFLDYVQDGFYDGTIFHRVIPGFMNQGGGFMPGLELKKTKPPIKNEADNGLSNKRGTLAMARTGIVDSATCQFFINTADNLFLDHRGKSPSDYGYAVFGKVIDGMDAVDKISKVKTHYVGPYGDVPVDDVVILKASLIPAAAPAAAASAPLDISVSTPSSTDAKVQ
jgi:cyclophilin family peptidyl-prolyl cis-trans isomerase